MTSLTELNELEIAPPVVVRQSAHDFATALAATLQFKAFEEAGERLKQDAAAQRAMEAYQLKQNSLQTLLMLNAVSPEERAELEKLREAFLAEPSVAAYFQAEADWRCVCQTAANLLSEHVGLSLTAACNTGCCG